jgi:hypothetical protein
VLAAGAWIAPLGRWLSVWTAQASQVYMLPKLLGDDLVGEERAISWRV